MIGATSTTWQYEVTVPYESEWTMQATAVDTAGQSDLRSADRTWLVSATATPPTVAITTPVVMAPPTAAAPLAIAPVRTTVRDCSSGLYVQANGTMSSAYALLDATLATPGQPPPRGPGR